jgi:pimeloyl-ACP methyl ester carboxylesterase
MSDTSAEIRTRTAHVNGIDLHLLEAGDPANPTVILSHGFPEGAYSWRHQLPVLAAAGYHVLAPDQRGYGMSSVPANVADYGIQHLTGDLNALLDEAGKDDAVFVGHDWGAIIVWEHAKLHPARVRAVVGVSVPVVNWPAPPTQLFQMVYQDNFFYILYFQRPNEADDELGADPYETMRKVLWGASGDGFAVPTEVPKMAGTGFLTNMPEPPPLPWSWCDEADVQHYADQFRHSGFFGPVSYYRNLDANYELVKDIGLDTLTMPTYFITGSKDVVAVMDPTGIERMQTSLPNFRGATVIDGAGHWTQQEGPVAFNEALLRYLRDLDG